MSEGAMERLTAALEANTAAMNKMIEMSGGKAAPAGKAASSKPAEKPAAGKGKAASGGKKKKTTVDDIAKAFGGYLSVKDKDERAERAANVKAIVEYFGVAKATEIDEGDFDEALKYLQQYIDGETPEFDGGEEDGGEEEEESLV